ncbi:MAG: glycoside hydrolase family 9 protein [Fibrobacterales bacterium]
MLYAFCQNNHESSVTVNVLVLYMLVTFTSMTWAQEQPLPYEPIAIPIADTVNQIVRDSLNITINPIRVNQAGYRPQDIKTFYYFGSASTFRVINTKTGSVEGSGDLESTSYSGGASLDITGYWSAQAPEEEDQIRYTMSGEFPSKKLSVGVIPDGLAEEVPYVIEIDGVQSADFIISPKTYTMVKDALLKFYGIQRSGNSESWFHPPAHMQDPTLGGWYDCGDHLKEGITQSHTASVLGMSAAVFQERDTDHYGRNHNNTLTTDGIGDILYELKHGVDYVFTAYDNANGDIPNMVLSIGEFGKDHSWWGQPQYQDFMEYDRGGPDRPGRTDENYSTVLGRFSASLAFFSKLYQDIDQTESAKAINIAAELYEQAKSQKDDADKNMGGSSAYGGESSFVDDMAFGALALFWATGDTKYLDDMIYTNLNKTWDCEFLDKGCFEGGWFGYNNETLRHGGTNTSWGSTEIYVLYAFYKLILQTDALAAEYGIDSDTRLELVEKVIYSIVANIESISEGSEQIEVASKSKFPGNSSYVKYEPVWYMMMTQMEWVWNRYQAGNITELYVYYDVAKDLEGVALPNGTFDGNSEAIKELVIHQLDYMLGINPWDISMIYGIGDKNFNHPHHRGANFEGKNLPGAFYPYRPPVGALQGGRDPRVSTDYVEKLHEYKYSEVCLDGTTAILVPTLGMAVDEDLNSAPESTVQIEYVGHDRAIIRVKQTKYGKSEISFGTTEDDFEQVIVSDSAGMEHLFELNNLDNSTTYYFSVKSFNIRSGNYSVQWKDPKEETPFDFTTNAAPAGSAEIRNIRVCNITADSAEIMWFTPNGKYESSIYWDEDQREYDDMDNSLSGDLAGLPTRFHRIKIGGLTEQTTYYFAVESGGQVVSVNEEGEFLKFTTPVEHVDFDLRSLIYTKNGLQFLSVNVINQDTKTYDSLELRIYMTGTEEEFFIEPARDDMAPPGDGEYQFGLAVDECIPYSSNGYPRGDGWCSDSDSLVQFTHLKKIEDTYNPETDEWDWYMPIPLGDTYMASGARMRMDVAFRARSPYYPYSDLIYESPNHTFGGSDWSYRSHSRANGDPVDFNGIVESAKEDQDTKFWTFETNPYITVYRKDEYIWGFSPSQKEMETKRAHYDLTVTLDDPFNVPNGTYVAIDNPSSTIMVTGTAAITEGGFITDIWVNGEEIGNVSDVASYNVDLDVWELDIPARMGIGGNMVDITIFAGPDPECEPCKNNGGCAFANKSFFVEFSKGDRTQAVLKVEDDDGKPIQSPAQPNATEFHIVLDDTDNLGNGPLEVMIFNPARKDTVIVELEQSGGLFKTDDVVEAIDKKAYRTGSNEISFMQGDTVYARYVDKEDDEDVWEQAIFFSESPEREEESSSSEEIEEQESSPVEYVSSMTEEERNRSDEINASLTPLNSLLDLSKISIDNDYEDEVSEEQTQFRVLAVESGKKGNEYFKMTEGSGVLERVDEIEYHTEVPEPEGLTFELKLALGDVYEYDITHEMYIYDYMGQYVNRVQHSFTLTPEMLFLLDDTVRIYIEWALNEQGIPVSESGRPVATGVYVTKSHLQWVRRWGLENDIDEGVVEVGSKTGTMTWSSMSVGVIR